MEDKSIIKPILDALDYFNNSAEEINYFYKIIDKFSVSWFGRNINVNNLSNSDFTLIHDLLGEYIRFEENNKRIALWLLAINRICYNYTADLSIAETELDKSAETIDQNFDATLIEPILTQLRMLTVLHKNAGKEDLGQSDIISNFLQWVMVYTTIIYPSLENKMNFYEGITIKAMHFILLEFIKQRSNDKRLAYLIMAIIEACRQYSILKEKDCAEFVSAYNDDDKQTIQPGQEENLIREILDKLKTQTIKQMKNIDNHQSVQQYIKDTYDELVEEINHEDNNPFELLDKFIIELTDKLAGLTRENKIVFFKTLYRYRMINNSCIKDSIVPLLKKSINAIPDKSRDWITEKLNKFDNEKELYIKNIIQFNAGDTADFSKFAKPYITVFLIHKFKISIN